ncbi:MAG TPA: PAS-domain containing protein, partial [Hyphomicrobiaceae bacterium]|nr:PAS-domain containing protein [Hyphomicrobiaceae bacterium]
AFHAYGFAVREQDSRRTAWVFLTGLCTGAGVWATHLVATLASAPSHATRYDPALTMASLIIAAAVAVAGFALSARGGRSMAAAGGAFIGGGFALMHPAGLWAIGVGRLGRWEDGLVLLVIGATLAAVALLAWRELGRRRALWVAPLLLTVAICVLHFGVTGSTIRASGASSAGEPSQADGATLAVAVSAAVLLSMIALLAMMLIAREGKRDSRFRSQELVDAALEGLVVARDGYIVNANRRFVTLAQRSPADLLGRRLIGDLVTGLDREAVGGGRPVEGSLQGADGRVVPVEIVRGPLTGSSRANEVYAVRDLTGRRMIEADLRRQNEVLQEREEDLRTQNQRFEATLANMEHGLCMIDPEQRIVVCNKRYAEMYNLPEHLARPGMRIADIFAYRVAQGLYSAAEDQEYESEDFKAGIEPTVKVRRLKDGRTLRISRRPSGDGGWIAIHEDITEAERLKARLEEQFSLLQQREAELSKQNANLDVALETMSQGLAMFDAEERLVLANDRYAEIYGLDPAHLRAGMTLHDLVRYRKEHGLYRDRTVEEVVTSMRKQLRESRTGFLTRPADGLVLCVSARPRADGGWVVTIEDVTEREELHARLMRQNTLLQQREEELAAQNELFDTAIGNMSQGMCLYDAEERVVFANHRYADIYGMNRDLVKPGMALREIFEARVADGTHTNEEGEKFVRDGIARFRSATSEIVHLRDGRFISVVRRPMPGGGLLSTHEDITERERLNERLEQQNVQLKAQEKNLTAKNVQLDAALNNMLQGLAMYDSDHRLVVCNTRFSEMYGLPAELTAPGTPLHKIIAYRITKGEHRGKTPDELIAGVMKRASVQKTVQFTSELGDGRYISVSVQSMPDGGLVTTHHDITAQRQSEAKITYMALHDTLTNLPNRVLLNERLDDALRRVKRGEVVAALLLDLDQFKAVNDTLGHPAGDKLLVLVADRLRAILRDTETIARMGGDEFAIVQAGVTQPADVTALAHRVIEVIGAPYAIEGQQVVIGTSIGIALAPADGETPDQLIRNADLALYRAKADGRGTYRFFERGMDAQMQVRRAMEYDLREAWAAGQFELHYQAMLNLASDEVSGFEALVRWRHPDKGMISPGDFIPLAEEMGLIVPLGEWAIREACAAAAKWPGELKVAVNLSPVQFRGSGLVHVVVNALAASGLQPERLELEITENTLLQDSDATLNMLYQLRSLGVRIAMDDFGTGYSSLSYLQAFPFDKIKIDRSFVKDIADGVGSLNIVRAVAAMASGLGMTTTAEGVETKEQMDTVRAEGCTELQGYLFCRPLPLAEVEPFLRRFAKRGKGKTAGARKTVGAA